jgi:hypothetical protein
MLFIVRAASVFDDNPKAIGNFIIAAILFAVFICAAVRSSGEVAANAKATCAAVEAQAVSVAGRWQCVK